MSGISRERALYLLDWYISALEDLGSRIELSKMDKGLSRIIKAFGHHEKVSALIVDVRNEIHNGDPAGVDSMVMATKLTTVRDIIRRI